MPANRSASPVVPRFLPPGITGTAKVNVGPTERLVSALGGAVLAGYGFSRGTAGGAVLGSVGAILVLRGASGYCPAFGLAGISTAEATDDTPPALEITETLTVARSPDETYAFWRKLENLPRFMHHLESVTEMGDGRSLWKTHSPGPLPDLQWEATILEDEPGKLLVWQSVDYAAVDNAGHVQFTPAPHGGTEVRVRIAYRPPAGDLGHVLAKAFDGAFARMVKEDVRRFKSVLEAGQVPTIEGQSRGD